MCYLSKMLNLPGKDHSNLHANRRCIPKQLDNLVHFSPQHHISNHEKVFKDAELTSSILVPKTVMKKHIPGKEKGIILVLFLDLATQLTKPIIKR